MGHLQNVRHGLYALWLEIVFLHSRKPCPVPSSHDHMTCLMLSLAFIAVEAPADRTSLAMAAMDPEAVNTSFNQPHIVLGEIA